MREITDAQAQELANMLKLIIAGDKSKEVYAFAMHPDKCENAWFPCKTEANRIKGKLYGRKKGTKNKAKQNEK